ncbi:Tetratricopeptide-like helical [Artemisia annua]|uniref:Tetratricopeptide-like helical n=1 Tax=Artemisia annua TaxID=35608 RepID=A0A2U1KVD1_ARTAN|nr:Tetratricopeptide-like helical [Artemisia annua]
MGVKVTNGCLNWSQSSYYFPPSSSPQTLASAISSPSTRRVALVFRYIHRPVTFGTIVNRREKKSVKHVLSASLHSEFSDEELFKEIDQDLSLIFLSGDSDHVSLSRVEPPEWAGDMFPESIERKANSVELPFSLRMIQRKKQWKEGVKEAGESAYSSVKKAFSSMVFIIRELQSYTLQMRETLFYEDLQGVLAKVHKEMNASFVWLFQQVFSHTPTLMVYVMILLANYSVYAMSNNVAFAVAPPTVTMESILSIDNQRHTKIDSSSIKTFEVNSGGKTTSIGGINGGGGISRPAASGTDGGERFDGNLRKIIPDGASVSGQETHEGEFGKWKSIVEEADNMQDVIRYGVLDRQTMQRFVSPVTAKVVEVETESEGHFRTELLYQMGLSEEPNNPLLLANYAQFLYIVAQDYDRAEKYFKRASKVEPKDAEALSKYANFLLEVKKDLWAAEETLLEAIAVDPINPYYAATYANFLWGNEPDDTCFPLDSNETAKSDDL